MDDLFYVTYQYSEVQFEDYQEHLKMGRTNAKLVPFLKENLQMRRFMNLQYETETIFYIVLPRFNRDIREEYENILKAWYECNGKSNRYQGYSNGKSVLQAALKKSDYLMPLSTIGKRLRFRFATPDEIKENKRRSKEKVKSNLQPPSPSSDPPSVASSGYASGNDWEVENVQTVDNSCKAENVQSVDNNYEVDNMQTRDIDMCMPDDFLQDVLKHPEDYIGDNEGLDNIFSAITTDDFLGEFPPLQSSNSFDTELPQIMAPEVFEPLDKAPEFTRPVTELKLTPVGNFGCEKKYWRCTQKLNLKGMLQLICEMQVVEDGSEIKEGTIVIPDGVFEPRRYSLNLEVEFENYQEHLKMGRTNAKLVPFLKDNLQMRRFMNLKYETETIFYIEIPRFSRDRCEEYENILKAWYEYNGKSNKYQGYSNGKSVLQAALKKSVYLISLPTIGKRLRFRFATQDEITENKRLLKEKVKSNLQPLSPSSDPPSVASSGYTSGNDWDTENVQTVDNNYEADNVQTRDVDMCISDDILEDVLKHPECYIGDNIGLEDLFSAFTTNDFLGEFPPLQNSNSFDTVLPEVMQSEVFQPLDKAPEFTRPVTELKPTPVGNFVSEKKYWLCTQKLNLKGMLQLICEMQVVEDGSEVKEGSIVIPKGVFEPGKSYRLNKSFELNELLFCFCTQDIA